MKPDQGALSVEPTLEDLRTVAPAFAKYTEGPLLGELWQRPDLSSRDRSIITAAVLIARNQSIEMPYYFNLALDNGVKPTEISEIITHIWLSIPVGPTPRPQQRLPKSFLLDAASANFHRKPASVCPLMKLRRLNARPEWNRMPVQWLRESSITQVAFYSTIFGYVPR
jgi:alkylhydroperoxidase/carboxymuconolactone decarboxylase family protein YurZ